MRANSLIAALIACTAVTSAASAASADGVLDTSWGLFGTGKSLVLFDYGGSNTDVAAASVTGPDGSLYIAGTVQDAGGIRRMAVTKLGPDGLIDEDGFGGGDGRVTSPVIAGTMVATGIAMRNNTLYVGGYREVNATNRDFAVCVFSTGGVPLQFLSSNSTCVTASFDLGPTLSADFARAIAVQADGKIVLAGHTAVSSANDTYAAFARFNTNGSLDNSFGLGNSGQTLFRSSNIFVRHNLRSVAIASNGKIVAAGSTVVVNSTDQGGLLVRLNTDGSVDQLTSSDEYTFSVDQSSSRDTVVNDLVLVDSPTSLEDDMVVVGYAQLSGTTRSGMIAKIKNGNVLDSAGFSANDGSGGYATYTDGDGVEYNSVAVQAGKGFVVGATSFPSGAASDFLIGRYTFNGTVNALLQDAFLFNDFDFNLNGQFDTLADVQVRGDGIYAVGTGMKTDTNSDFVAAKLTLDRIFGHGFESGF